MLQVTQGNVLERFGIANTEYRYIGIKLSVNTGISTAFGVFLSKQIELRNADKNKFRQNFYMTRTVCVLYHRINNSEIPIFILLVDFFSENSIVDISFKNIAIALH